MRGQLRRLSSRAQDALGLAALTVLAIGYAIYFIDFSRPPFEDAAILMRYAKHFAEGHGIVWNIGEAPIDGATDFLFMICVALLVKAGLSLELATRSLGFVSHIATVWIVYLSLRRLCNANIVISLLCAAYLAVGPGLYYVAAYFGTPFFALFAAVAWRFALQIIQRGENRITALAFAFSALVTALIRPEGVILTALMVLSLVYICGISRVSDTLRCYLAVFALIGGAYFLWRWTYFGFPLPNPYYKKGAGMLYSWSFKLSLWYTFKMCLPVMWAFLLGFYSKDTSRLTLGFTIPLAGFASAFILIAHHTNFWGRFQYPLAPMAVMCWYPLTEGARKDVSFPKWRSMNLRKKSSAASVVAFLALLVLFYGVSLGRTAVYYKDGLYDMAKMLSDYKGRGFTMATTEAGLLPLYSGWRALDAWGLNDQWIAHHERITEEYLDRFKPHLIVFHEWFSPLVEPANTSGKWFEMVMTLKRYAEKHGYILAAAFGESPYDTHYYYVRPDFPESREIVKRIRDVDYRWFATGNQAINYALVEKKPNDL
ncbi:MAG: hypothetical protein ACP5LD_08485 [Desulfomonilaceae bacterium]